MNGIRERFIRGGALKKNLRTLSDDGFIDMLALAKMLNARSVKVSVFTLRNTKNGFRNAKNEYGENIKKEYVPPEKTTASVEPLVEELIREKSLHFCDWKKNFKL